MEEKKESQKKEKNFQTIGEAFSIIQDEIDNEILENVITGFPSIDNNNGFFPGDLIVIAARPGEGKSAFAINLAVNMATNNKTVAVFSLENSVNSFSKRALSIASGVTLTNIQNNKLSDEEKEKINETVEKLKDIKLYIDDTPNISTEIIRNECQQLKKNKIDIIIIDYIQLMSKNEESKSIIGNLKAIAREFKVPVIALSQLTQNDEDRIQPNKEDLKDAEVLLQTADVIAFLYKDGPRSKIYNLLTMKNHKGYNRVHIFGFKQATGKFIDTSS